MEDRPSFQSNIYFIMDVPRVGYIGLGDMGGLICAALVRAAINTVVFDVAAERIAPLAEAGAYPATSPLDVARRSDVIFLCVVNDAQVRDVLFGHDGLAGGLDMSKLVVVNSSVSPETIRNIAASPQINGAALLDAPVSGSRPAAREGRLTVMIGGDAESVSRVRPILETFCSTIFHVGPLGTGQSMKIANNVMLHMNHLIALEALRFARSQGIDEKSLISVVNASTGRSWVTETWGLIDQMMMDHPQAGTSAMYGMMSKELWNAVLLSHDAPVPVPFTALGAQLSRSYFEEREGDLKRSPSPATVELRQ
jgi:3-hydroxyisobutyrate dehydrogenase